MIEKEYYIWVLYEHRPLFETILTKYDAVYHYDKESMYKTSVLPEEVQTLLTLRLPDKSFSIRNDKYGQLTK